jgi:putative transposase
LYNAALEERRGRWRWNREPVSYGQQSAQLKEIRTVCPEQSRWSFSSQQATLRRLNRAFAAFFRRCGAGDKPGYPRFRSQHRFDSVEWPKDGDGCRWKPEHRRVYLQGIGEVKVDAHRPVEGVVKTIAVKRDGRRWFLVLSCDDVPIRPLPATGLEVGVDLGVTVFLATSDGDLVDNPRHGRQAAGRLAAAQAAAHADVNAARNILRAGLALPAAHAARKQAGGFSRQRSHTQQDASPSSSARGSPGRIVT